MAEEQSLVGFLQDQGISLLDATEKMEELVKFLPKIKSWLPKIKEAEKTFMLKPNQRMIYSVVFEKDTALVLGLVAELMPDKSTKIVGEKFKVNAFEKIENFTAYLPK